MLDNRGWGTKDVFMVIFVMAIAVLVTMVIYNRNFKSLFEGSEGKDSVPTTEYNYVKTENTIKKAAKEYYNDNFGQSKAVIPFMTVSYDFLRSEDYIESLNANNEQCNGYVTIKNQDGEISYNPYIKCENYITEGYTASLNN